MAAIPILQGGGEHAGQPVENLVLRCGEYRAFWDGTLRGSSQKAPSMPYLYILEVDGVAAIKRMYVKK